MCAVQLCDRIRQTHESFWVEYSQQATAVATKLDQRATLRDELCQSAPEDMPAFMTWFDKWFLERAHPAEQA
jgi:hypothetical protein